MRNNALLFLFLLAAMALTAQKKNKKITFEVAGKCEMCKMRIEKAALSVTGVKYAFWDVPTRQLTIVMNENKTDAMKIKTALVAVGHDTQELKALEEAYENLHYCCRYREDLSKGDNLH